MMIPLDNTPIINLCYQKKKFFSTGCLWNMCYNKNSLLFQLVAINIYGKQSLRGVSWNQLKSEKCYTSWLHWKNHCRSTVRKHRTSMGINILLPYLLKTSLTHFIALVFFYTFWNTSENQGQMFPDVFRGQWKITAMKWVKSHLIFSYLFFYLFK